MTVPAEHLFFNCLPNNICLTALGHYHSWKLHIGFLGHLDWKSPGPEISTGVSHARRSSEEVGGYIPYFLLVG